MQIPSTSMFGSIFSTAQTNKLKAAGGMDMTWATAAPKDQPVSAARAEFADYAKKTPAEKMHDAILKQLGITEEEFKKMDPEKRAAVEEKIKQKIKEQIEAETGVKPKTGLIADIKV